jgi:hypothetical protein
VLIVVLVAPLVSIAASPWAADTGLFYAGMVSAVMGLLIGTRAALVANVLVPAGMVAGLVLSPHLPLGTLFMMVLVAVVGASSRLGWHGVGASLGPWVALALIDPPAVRLAQEGNRARRPLTTGRDGARRPCPGRWVVGDRRWAIALARLLCCRPRVRRRSSTQVCSARSLPSAPAWPRPSCWSWGTGSSAPVAVPDRHPGDRQRYPPRVLCGGVRLVRWSILLRSTCGGT